MGGEKAFGRAHLSSTLFVLCPAFPWSLGGLHSGFSEKSGCPGMEQRVPPALSPVSLRCTASGNPLNSPASLCTDTFLADFSVGHLLNNIFITYPASPSSQPFSRHDELPNRGKVCLFFFFFLITCLDVF